MFRAFFCIREWACWAWGGIAVIVSGTWFLVYLDVLINGWFGVFYDLIQKALEKPGNVDESEIYDQLFTFAKIAGLYVLVAVLLGFFTKHYCFRWRTAINFYYMEHWASLRKVEGASQRVQEDTRRFSMITESLGAALLEALTTLFAFLPILWRLSEKVKVLPVVGEVSHSLVFLTVGWAIIGTTLLGCVGIRLPGLEFKNQLVEAAYRKELVYGEDDESRADPPTVEELFGYVRKNYFTLYLNFMYFDVAKFSYLQFGSVVPYMALGPTIAAAGISLGTYLRISSSFYKVESSFQFLIRNWVTIVEYISIYKRLRQFSEIVDDDDAITTGSELDDDYDIASSDEREFMNSPV